MVGLLIFVLLVLCIFSFWRKKDIFSPGFIFNFIWLVTLCLYELKFSYIQQDLSNKTILIFFACVLSYNLILIVLDLFKVKPISFNFNIKSKTDIKDKLKYAKLIVLIIFVIQIIYSGGFPLIWKLLGSNKNYFNFGIPSLNGAFCGLVVCLGAYSIFTKSKDKFLYLSIGILIISRQIIMSMLVESFVFAVYSYKDKLKTIYKKIIIIGIVALLGFTLLGNFRSGSTVMDDVFQAKEQYKELPSTAKWVYSYMTFSVSNFNNLVSKTNGFVNYGVSMFNELVPTILANALKMKPRQSFDYLISPNYNVSTYLPSVYLDFGILGVSVFNMLMAIFGYQLYSKMNEKGGSKNILLYSVFVHNIIFLFFNNMFLYLPIIVQFVYIPLLFSEKEKKLETKNRKLEQKDLVSVVVPVYNVEKYLKKCIDSIISQTYKNIEILLIDDGSTDSCAKICDEYKKADERIRVYHKQNGGLSSARNYGIDKSKGKYICFIDSDDYIDNNMIEQLYRGCIENNVDLSWCDKIIEYDNGASIEKRIYNDAYLMTKEEAFSNILLNDPSVCDKMFNRDLFKDVKFPVGKLYEDIITINHLIYKCDKIYHVGEAYYHYIQREDSIVHKEFDLKKLDYIKNAKLLKKYVYDRFPNLKNVADSYYILTMNTVLCDMYPFREKFKKDYQKLKNEMKDSKNVIIKNKFISFSKKIMCILVIYDFIGLVNLIKKVRNTIKSK